MGLRSIESPNDAASGKLRMARYQSVLFILILGCLTVACGGDDSSSSGGESGGGGQGGGGQVPGQVVPIRGGERIAWDQAAPSVQAARGYSYRLFIDGALSSITDIRCSDTRTSAGYECSGLLPGMSAGQHSLEVAALAGSAQSASSVPLLVRVGSASVTGVPVVSSSTGFGI